MWRALLRLFAQRSIIRAEIGCALVVVFSGPFAMSRLELANRRNTGVTMGVTMAHTLRLKQTYRRNQSGISDTIKGEARSLAADHRLALLAAEKAASPRKNLAEIRAMYVSTPEPQADDSTVEKNKPTR